MSTFEQLDPELPAISPSIDTVMRHVDHMQRNFPYRKSGLGQDVAAAEYVVAQMRSFGLEAELEEFMAYDSDPGEAVLEMLSPVRRAIKVVACTHVDPTPDGGFTGDVVDVGAGGIADYEGRDVAGKIVLAEVSYAPATPEKARIAAEMGAAGIILMNWGQDNGTVIPSRGLKGVWGNPTPYTWHDIPRLFGASISRKDGIAMREALKHSNVTVRITVTATRVWRKLVQPICHLRAPTDAAQRDQFLIVSGHIDSWNPGVTDNLTGNSVMMAIAEALAQQRDRLQRSVVFCFWNGHEVAEATGSACFVDKHWEEIRRNAVGYFNIDSVGMKGTTEFRINSCPEFAHFSHFTAEYCFGTSLPIRVMPLNRVGDQSFFGAGVSAVTGRHMFSDEMISAQNGASLGWYNHTEFDTMDELDPDVLADDLRWCAEFIGRMIFKADLAQRLGPRMDDLSARFDMVLAQDPPADLDQIMDAIRDLAPLVAWFDDYLDAMPENATVTANKVLLRLTRLLTFPAMTACGRYGQDSYGISTLAQPVPRLAEIARYQNLNPTSQEARLLETSLIRKRHEMTDAFAQATDILLDFKSLSTQF